MHPIPMRYSPGLISHSLREYSFHHCQTHSQRLTTPCRTTHSSRYPLIQTTTTATLNDATPSQHRGRERATYTPLSSSSTSSPDSDSVSSSSSPTAGAPNDAILVPTDNNDEDPIAHPVHPDHRPALPPARIPFTGDFRGCTWNAQALFARGWRKQNNNMRQARSLLATHDFVALQETHSTEGRSRMLRLPHQCAPFYSHHDSTHTAGVCVWVKRALLRQFNPTTIDSWIEVAPGRAAILRLDGPRGFWISASSTSIPGQQGPNGRQSGRLYSGHYALRRLP